MKVEIINKVMLCWNEDEDNAKPYHVLAKVTEHVPDDEYDYPFKAVTDPKYSLMIDETKNRHIKLAGYTYGFKHVKAIRETIPLTVLEINGMNITEIAGLINKNIKIISNHEGI